MIRALIFDYGGTLDTNSEHWSHVIWKGYQAQSLTVRYDHYRLAYVHGERSLAKFPLIRPEHNFLDLLRIKLDVQTSFLVDAGFWPELEGQEPLRRQFAEAIARFCYDYVLENLRRTRPVLQSLAKQYPLVLVSNFYGNLCTVLHDFQLDVFPTVVESALVGVRKPDPRIFQLAINTLGLSPDSIAVVGDSLKNDIRPASSLGLRTIWLSGSSWDDVQPSDPQLADITITDIAQLPDALTQLNGV